MYSHVKGAWMLVDSRFPSVFLEWLIFKSSDEHSHPTYVGLPPRIKNTYIDTCMQTDRQTNKHRKRQTAVWLRPYVFNIGQKWVGPQEFIR